MTGLLVFSVGLALLGPLAAIVSGLVYAVSHRWRARVSPPPIRLILILLLLELRSGRSVLAALTAASDAIPEYGQLKRVARLALISGLPAALDRAPPSLRPLLTQLARARRSGASLQTTVRRLLEEDLAEDRATRLARARALPVRLMLPVTLLMLPGLVLLLYAPSLLRVFNGLTGAMF